MPTSSELSQLIINVIQHYKYSNIQISKHFAGIILSYLQQLFRYCYDPQTANGIKALRAHRPFCFYSCLRHCTPPNVCLANSLWSLSLWSLRCFQASDIIVADDLVITSQREAKIFFYPSYLLQFLYHFPLSGLPKPSELLTLVNSSHIHSIKCSKVLPDRSWKKKPPELRRSLLSHEDVGYGRKQQFLQHDTYQRFRGTLLQNCSSKYQANLASGVFNILFLGLHGMMQSMITSSFLFQPDGVVIPSVLLIAVVLP